MVLVVGMVVYGKIIAYRNGADARRRRRLLQDTRYQDALLIYDKCLPEELVPTREEKKAALLGGISYLLTVGIPEQEAQLGLCLLVRERDREESIDLWREARGYEDARDWEQAIECYEEAASLQEEWDREDFESLQLCIKRVRAKQGRTQDGI